LITLYREPLVLTDGGIETRIMYESHRSLRDFCSFELLDDAEGRAILTQIYRSYAEVAARFDLPIQLGTPTWRASQHWTTDVTRYNREAVALVRDAIAQTGARAVVAGAIGPATDGYDPTHALGAAEAEAYHREQAAALADAGVDILYAATFPSCDALAGACAALAQTRLPFAVAPMIRPDGMMMDGTPLATAIERLDADPSRRPWHYMLGCIYPTHAATALAALFRAAPDLAHRVVGLKANGSPLPPEELEEGARLEQTEPQIFARDLWACAHEFGLTVLGGCCGTDARHIEQIAEQASQRA